MKTRIYTLGRVLIVLFIAGLLITACQSTASQPAGNRTAAAAPELDAEAARWVAMAHRYEALGMMTRGQEKMSAGDLSAMRWMAMGCYYQSHGMIPHESAKLTPGELSAMRWIAMARYYEAHNMLNQHTMASLPLTVGSIQ